MIGLICLGFVFLVIGYSRRNRDYGIVMMAVGIGIMFATLGYKFYLELS
ncbi:hypothetical protein G7032_09855 [Pseudomonas monteilii]|nr:MULTISPECIES: hypothetical protein [Pseudomonas]ELS0924934.1 hypothetical protein [Pseudomonas putida]MBA1316170.1 hypothetical protein [Pseudomonas monteilii]QUN67046.1 hypothetical protein KDB76_24910 [Pseudomonas sp. JS425]